MGSCLGKKIKRNSVDPAPEKDDIYGKRGSRSEISGISPTEMKKQLEEGQFEDSKIATGGVAFVVDSKKGDPERMPSRLAARLEDKSSISEKEGEVHYSAAEKEILAELYRDDILREKKEKASRDVKIYDAARRRAARKMPAAAE